MKTCISTNERDRLKSTQIAVVIPAHNEAQFIRNVLLSIPEWVTWIVVVDDASVDDSRKIVESIPDPRIHLIAHQSNMGAGAAIITGYKKALSLGSKVVAVMGGDGQMDPADLARVTMPVAQGWVSYIKGNRFLYNKLAGKPNFESMRKGDIPFFRYWGITFFTFITQLATGRNDFGDSQCGFTAVDRNVLEMLDLDSMSQRYGFPNDMILNINHTGFSMAEVPVRPVYGDEKSGIRPWRDLPSIIIRIIKRMKKAPSSTVKINRIVMVTSSFPRHQNDHSGDFIARLAKELARTLPVTVIAPDSPGAVWAPQGVSIRRFRWKGWDRVHALAYGHGIIENLSEHPFSLLPQVLGFLRAMRSVATSEIRENDMVISHWLFPGSWIASMGSKDRRHLAVAHGSDLTLLERLPFILRRMLLKRIGKYSSRIITVSNNLAQRLENVSTKKRNISVMPMPVDIKKFDDIRRSRAGNTIDKFGPSVKKISGRRKLNVLFMGRLIPIKGVDILLKALQCIPEARQKCVVHIAGDGPLLDKLEQTACSANLPIVFHGHVSGKNKENLLCISDIGVVPSIITKHGGQDGLPTVLMELMASEIPVIATQSGGIPDVIISEFNGILIVPGDPIELAKALNDLMINPAKRSFLAENALKTVKKHTIENFAGACLDMLMQGKV